MSDILLRTQSEQHTLHASIANFVRLVVLLLRPC